VASQGSATGDLVTEGASSAPPLTKRLKLSFAVGSTAEAVTFQGTSMFLLLFYNQVLGVSPGLVGLALSAGLMVNAVFEPLVGSWSDRVRTRYGRRHPFMFASALPIALSFFALFSPPSGLGSDGLLVWLTVMWIIHQQAVSLYEAPHLALGGEMSRDYLERTSIMAYATFFLWIGDALTAFIALRYFFPTTPAFPNGALDPANYPHFALSIATTILILRLYAAWATRKRIPYLSLAEPSTPSFSFVEFWRDIVRALGNRKYVILLFALLFFSLMTGVRNGIYMYKMTYFWEMTNNEISWFIIGSAFGYIFAAFVVKRLHAKLDKRWTGALACFTYTVGPAIPMLLGYLGILTPSTPYLLAILIAFSVLQHAPYSILTTTVRSVIADIADENELRTGLRQEGILYAARQFFQRIDTALGTMLAGWALVFINFPEKATPGQVDHEIVMGIGLVFVLTVVPGLIASIFYALAQATRSSYDATQAALALGRTERGAAHS
jgi:glycoside/pentoside/hexuronide:cation symporter, GPH family